jgi:3-oxoacyl-[acyl-carrier-protein] synthase-3
MKFRDVRIAGLGYELPPSVLSSDAIEDRLAAVYERIGLVPGRLELMTGIKERRFWPETTRPSVAATRAGQQALDKAGLDLGTIGCLINASVCRDFLEPATASVVHEALGLPRSAQFFDLSNACLGVANAMLLVGTMIDAGVIDAGLIVAGENGQGLVDSTIESLLRDPTVTRKSIKSSFASLTIGSGGAAVLLAKADLAPSAPRLIGGVVRSGTEYNHLCRGGVSGDQDSGVDSESKLAMTTDAEALLVAGLGVAEETWALFRQELDWNRTDRVVTHQVGRAHSRALFERLGLDEALGYITYDRLGNVGSVSVPITLAMAEEDEFIREGDHVALLGIGSGLSSVMLGVEW